MNEVSKMCGISLSLLVKDGRSNKITEYHTDNGEVKLENIIP